MDKKVLKIIQTLRKIDKKYKTLKHKKDALKIKARDPKFYKGLQEIAYNVIKSQLKLKPSLKRKLRKHKKALITFVLKKPRSVKQKDKIIEQSGGFINILVPLLISLLSTVKNGAY